MRKPEMAFIDNSNMSEIVDFYEITMANGYFQKNMHNDIVTFDLFVRSLPANRGYLLACGLEQALGYLEEMRFGADAVEYLKNLPLPKFKDNFLEYLEKFKFRGDAYAIPEGTPVFGQEPLIRLTGPRLDVQIAETFLLTTINFQTMIASKASRVVNAAKGRSVVDFGARRAHSPYAAVMGARASYVAGCTGTSDMLAARKFNIPIAGTMAHSWIMSFEDEAEAFRAYAEIYPDSTVALTDTYDVKKGAENAAKLGNMLKGVRIDSGDLAEGTKISRKVLDENGARQAKITLSSDLNEFKIEQILLDGAPVDIFGVGTEMIVSKDAPALGGVYKLAEDVDALGNPVPKIKLSEGKITYPGKKQVWRVADKDGMYIKDVLALESEDIGAQFEYANPLLVKVMEKGEIAYDIPELKYVREACIKNVSHLPPEYKVISNPAKYPVEIAPALSALVDELKKEWAGR